ncbi:MAG: hypothetical protein HY347_07945 [candidate division NC10 bacterium]|nr:hypothetical protein [candidate division NC10 bacterium]
MKIGAVPGGVTEWVLGKLNLLSRPLRHLDRHEVGFLQIKRYDLRRASGFVPIVGRKP